MPNRSSWMNMHGQGEGDSHDIVANSEAVTPSPQTMRGYGMASNNAIAGGVGGGAQGGAGGVTAANAGSGRTTATSGRISSSGVATISGSSNTLNDNISDFQDVSSINGDYHHHHHHQHHSPTHHHPPHHPHHRHMNHPFVGTSSTPSKNFSSNGSFDLTNNGSRVKLLSTTDDANQQTKCSVFRGLVLCICLNVTYANIVRFPRELDKYGSAYLIPYVTLLFLVGLPILLLEIALGQFLGQGAAHTWRASPIFKGACIIGRFASWLATVWISLQAVLALGYIVMLNYSNMIPFNECVSGVKIEGNGYKAPGKSGQECLAKTFLTPFWDNPFYYGVLSIGLICIWIVVMLCTHNSRVLRRSLFFFGLLGLVILCALTGWEVHISFEKSYFPELQPFEWMSLQESHIWFNALAQVLFAMNCGFGVLPMITGKFLYKGDAVRTSIVYLCFNLLINAIAVTLFMIQFDSSANSGSMIDELKPLSATYDRSVANKPSNELLAILIPSAIYALVLLSTIITIIVAIYTASRLVPRHPNYFISLIALVVSIISFAAPRFMIARILDSRIIGTMIVTALTFDLIAITWIYGAKNVYTDLEFSIGRPIFKGWMVLWYICPAILTGLLVWWCSDDDSDDLLPGYVPRWAPIIFVLVIICIIACVQIFRQVEYNFFGMICEASKPAKEWGPADPLARHSWKQWRSVCQDTGRRDFTLRRRGTRDYTHSIKNTTKYANGHASQTNWKSTTPGNSSPNYSGSMFGDSAIEEDMSVDKFPVPVSQQFVPFHQISNHGHEGKPLRYSHRSQRIRNGGALQQSHAQPQRAQPQSQSHSQSHSQSQSHMQPQPQHKPKMNGHLSHSQDRFQNGSVGLGPSAAASAELHREVVYIRRLSNDEGQLHATRIEITPSNESITYGGARNPLARIQSNHSNRVKRSASASGNLSAVNRSRSAIHIYGGSGGGSGSVIGIGIGQKNSQSSQMSSVPPPPSRITAFDDSAHLCWRKQPPAISTVTTTASTSAAVTAKIHSNGGRIGGREEDATEL